MRLFHLVALVGLVACGSESVFEGELRISSEADLALLEGVDVVAGNLQITTDDLQELTLGSLTRVEGDLWIQLNPRLTTLSIPNLSSVSGGFLVSRNERLTSIGFSALRSVGGSFAISYNCRLPSGQADSIAGDVSIGCEGVASGGNCIVTAPNMGDDGC